MKRNKIIFYICVVLILLSCATSVPQDHSEQSITTSPQYEKTLAGYTLEAGIGFVGLVTVYDTPALMHDLLGTPREDLEFPFTYFYDDGSFAITFNCEFNRKDMNFRIDQIILERDPEQLIKTSKGIALGDDIAMAKEKYGSAYDEYSDGVIYPDLGIGFIKNTEDTISEIIIYRVPKPELPKWLEYHFYLDKLQRIEVLDMQIEFPPSWDETVYQKNSIAGYDDSETGASLLISKAYEDENFSFVKFVYLQEAIFIEENLIPEKDRLLTKQILVDFGANQGYIAQSVSGDGTKRNYMMIFEKTRYPDDLYQDYYYTISLDIPLDSLNISIEPDEKEIELVSAIMTSISLNGPLLPECSNADSLGPEAVDILPSLEALISAAVFRDLEGLCAHLLDFDRAYDEQIIAPRSRTKEGILEDILDITKEINEIFMAEDYTISYIGTDIDDLTWYGLEITNVLDEKIIMGFVKYEDRYLLGDID